MHIHCKRVYESPSPDDGFRVLVDRLWPRGIRKENLPYDRWEKDLAPSPDLRRRFGHREEKWDWFRQAYSQELENPGQRERMTELLKAAGQGPLTLLYAARDTRHNHAIVLAKALKALY